MLTSYLAADNISPCPPGAAPDWIDVSDPSEAELAELAQAHQLPPWFLTDPLDPKERPRVDQDGLGLLIVARLSFRDDQPAEPVFRTAPVGLIITPELVITVCREPDLVRGHLSRFFQRRRPWSPARLAFALLHAAGTGFINNIERLEELAGEAEARLRLSPENEELLTLLNIEKALIDITVAVKSNHGLMDKIFRQPDPLGLILTKEEREILDDAMIENQQAIFMAEIFGQTLASMSDAFGSLIANNLNRTMKLMAGLTIVLMLPTIISGLYGMNVNLPLAESQGAFWTMCGLCLGLMLAVSVLFARKKWF
ncbi:MAG: magnesium transporter CorA family protein [Candidatus Adiutrix sp.]|jgi:magnesium transporter|nr:magnesium transporter CorA family protein [Candidatus Adiutrix sp.]